ncbi:hypothetical protein D9M70_433650 [compost metagenome]
MRQALAGRLGGEFQGAEEQRRAARQQAPQTEGQRAGQDPFEHPHGHCQEQHAEGVAHGDHPLAGPWQQCAAAGGEEHQGRAHAQAEGEEFQAAAQGVAACTDIEQGTGQGRGNAGRYQQAGEHAEQRRAPDRAALGAAGQAVQRATDEARQAQLEEAEHGQGEEGEEAGEGHQHPGRLQPRLEVEFGAEQAHQRTEQGEAGRHRQHVGQRQYQAAAAAHLAAQDHAGEDRQHRQHAGGEGQAQAGEEEQRQLVPAPALAACTAEIAAAAGPRAVGQLQHLGFRRVAQALVCAALVGHPQFGWRRARGVDGQVDVQYAVVHLDVAEVFVGLLLARRQHRLAQAAVGRLGAELETVTVEVVTLGIGEAQLHRGRRAFHQAEAEGLAYRQEVAAVVEGGSQVRARAVVQQPCGDGQGHQQQDQAQQAAHGDLLVGKCPHHSEPWPFPAGSGL